MVPSFVAQGWWNARGRNSPSFVFGHRDAVLHWNATSLQVEAPANTELSEHLRAELDATTLANVSDSC